MKRKVLISVLAVALVLTLCIGLFAACNPKDDSKPTQYTVTFSLGEYDGTDAAPAAQTVDEGSKLTLPGAGVTWADHTFLGWQLDGAGEKLAQGTEVTVNSNLNYVAAWQDDSEPALPKVTIYYTLGTELKSVTTDVMTAEEAGKYMLNEPYFYVPDEEHDAYAAQCGKAQAYAYYYYDAEATDHKGKAFAYDKFEAEADFSIIIIIESIGNPAGFINTEWYGYYTAAGRGDAKLVLELNEDNGGTIILDVTSGMGEPITQSINEGMASDDPMIYMSNDGASLILLEETIFGDSYNYYYITKNADGTMTVTSDGNSFTFSPDEKPEEPGEDTKVTVTIHYTVEGQSKTYVVDGEAVEGQEGTYKLSETPDWYLPEGGDYEAVTGSCGYGQKLGYYYYDADAADHKGAAFDHQSATFDKSIELIITVDTFATLAEKIDEKYDGTFTGTCKLGDFTLTIDAQAGTIKLDYGEDESAPNPVEASIEDGTIFTETDGGRLVFVEGSVQYAHYYYLKEASGALTLDSDYYQNIALTKQSGEEEEPTPEQGNIYVGTANVDEESQAVITKIEFDDFKEPSKVTVTYDKGEDKNQTAPVYLSTDTPESITGGPDGTVKHGYCSLRVGTVFAPVFNFGIGIYEDGTVVITDKGGKYIATFAEDKGGATQVEFADILGGYKSESGSYIYVSDKLKDDTYLGSFLYGGELMPVLSFAAAADGSYTLTALHSDYNDDFSATYKAADKSITIGTDAYTLDEEAPTASITDFVGYWERSDTHQYWDIQRFSISYGTTEPKSADFQIVGDYLYLFYQPTGSSTYYYLLQLHTEGDVKTLVGTFVAPETAPKTGITFNATEKYEAPVVLTEYATEKPITITASSGTEKTLTVSKIEIGTFDVTEKALANHLKIYVNIDGKEEVWEFTEIGSGAGKMFTYSSFEKDGILLAWTATYEKEGSTFKFVFGIKDTEGKTIYLYDYNSDAELGGLTLDGKGVEPGSGTDTPGPEDPELPEIPEGAVTYIGEAKTVNDYVITKVIIDPTQNVTSAIVTYTTKEGKEETKEFKIAPPSYGDNYWEGEYAGHEIKFYYANTGSDPNFNIVIYDDGTCMIGNGDDAYLATFKDENAGKVTYTGEATTESGYTITKVVIDTTQQVTSATVTYTKDGNEETKEFTIAPPSYEYKNYWNGNYAGHEIKFYYAYTASDPNFNIVIYDDGTCMIGDGDDGYIATFQREGGAQEEPTMLNGEYVLQGGDYAHRLVFVEDGSFTFMWRGSLATKGTYSSTGANTYYASDSDDDTFKITLNPDGTLTVDSNINEYDGTYAPYVAPDWAEYKGDVTITRGENSARLVYVKLNKNDLSSVTFKLYGDDKEYTVKTTSADDASYPGWLVTFKLDDGSLSTLPAPQQAYPQALIKYGDKDGDLTIADGNSTDWKNPTVLGTLSVNGEIPTPPAEEVSVWVMTDENGQSNYMKEVKVSKGTHKISEIIELLGGDLPTGKNKFWYFANRFKVGNASTGETKYSTDDLDCSASSTMLFAVFSDMTWYVGVTSRDDYPQLYFAHLGTTTGKGSFYKSYDDDYNGRGTDFDYEYDTSDYSITITLDGGESFKGTFGETSFNSFHYAVINITLTINGQEYKFGTGSPAEEQEQTPLSGEFELPEIGYPVNQDAHTLSFSEWEFTLDGTLTGTYSQKDSETYEGTVTDADETEHALQFTVTFDEDGTATSIYVVDDNNTYTGDYAAKSSTGGGIKITLKHGDHGTGNDVVLDAQAGVQQSIENSAYGRDDYFTAESEIWWWQAWIVNDDPDDIWNPSTYYGDGPRAFDADTTLTAYWSDLWSPYSSDYTFAIDIYLSHTDVDYTGKLWSEEPEVDEEITYHLDSEAGTIKITIGEDTFEGTYSFEDGDYGYELIINITLTYKNHSYKFGTGSSGTGGGTEEIDPSTVEGTMFEGTVSFEDWFGNSYTITKIKLATDGTATKAYVSFTRNDTPVEDIIDDTYYFNQEDAEYVEYEGESTLKYKYALTFDMDESSNICVVILEDGRIAICNMIGEVYGYFTQAA